MTAATDIVPRQGPDFGLSDPDLPRYWFGGDAFASRFFDAMSLLFPEGERFFIACVRDFRDQITDHTLRQQVRDFMYQEGQHGMVHTAFNNRLAEQGVAVDHILAEERRFLFGIFRKRMSRRYTLAQTAAAEHLTAMMAHGFFEKGLLADADPRVRAMYAWHAVEEIEHKAVAFDVYRDVAKGGYLTRVAAMLQVSITFPLHTFLIMRHMFAVDGLPRRGRVWLRGLWWLYGPRGVFSGMLGHWLAWFRPGFHPWRHGRLGAYERWRDVMETTGDAIAAGDAAAGRLAA